MPWRVRTGSGVGYVTLVADEFKDVEAEGKAGRMGRTFPNDPKASDLILIFLKKSQG